MAAAAARPLPPVVRPGLSAARQQVVDDFRTRGREAFNSVMVAYLDLLRSAAAADYPARSAAAAALATGAATEPTSKRLADEAHTHTEGLATRLHATALVAAVEQLLVVVVDLERTLLVNDPAAITAHAAAARAQCAAATAAATDALTAVHVDAAALLAPLETLLARLA